MVSRKRAAEVKDRHSARLLSMPGVIGVGVTQEDGDDYALTIHVEASDPSAWTNLPGEIEGCPVRVVQGEKYRKF